MLGDEPRGSLVPIGAAAAIFAVVVIVIAVLTLTGGDGLTDEQRVALAAVGQNDALQRQDYADYQHYTCPEEQGTEAEVLGAQRGSSQQRGARYVDDVTDVKIDGERASATVTYHFEKEPNKRTTPLAFARRDGQWTVCSAYR